MKLTKLINYIPEYLEYAHVCAPNAAGQALTANTVATCTIDAEVADDGNNGSISSNQITLAAGTYYFEVFFPPQVGGGGGTLIASLYNVTAGAYVTRGSWSTGPGTSSLDAVHGQMTIETTSVFEVRALASNSMTLRSDGFSNSTAGLDQRTTLRLWKLA